MNEPLDVEEWEVEAILASKVERGVLKYQVQWEGWKRDPEWYPASNLTHAPTALKKYHDEHPTHAGPPDTLQAWLDAELWGDEVPAYDNDDKPVHHGQQLKDTGRKRSTGVFLMEKFNSDEGVVLENATAAEVDDTASSCTLFDGNDEDDLGARDLAEGEVVVGTRQGADYPDEWVGGDS